jgi:hypothetical protein
VDLWPYVPQIAFNESMEWLTDVIRAKSAEQRIALREAPRHGYAHEYVMDFDQFSRARSFARARTYQEILLPLWAERTYVGAVAFGATSVVLDTAYAHYAVDGQFVVWQAEDVYEVRQATVVDPGQIDFATPLERAYTSAYVMPVRTAAFSGGLDVTRSAMDCVRASGRFVATDAEDLASLAPTLPQYRGHDVLLDRPVLLGAMRETHLRDTQIIDNSTGVVWRGDEFSYPTGTSNLAWQTHTREQLWDLRSWLHTRRGKWKGFWAPTYNADLTLALDIASANTTIRVNTVGYIPFGGPRDIVITLNSGTRHYFQLTGAAADGPGNTEVLTLTGAAGVNIAVADVASISFLIFSRLDADRVEIRHGNVQGSTTLQAPTREVPVS